MRLRVQFKNVVVAMKDISILPESVQCRVKPGQLNCPGNASTTQLNSSERTVRQTLGLPVIGTAEQELEEFCG